MNARIPVIDLFAGPGGLGEGFASAGRPDGQPGFKIRLSIEKEPFAHATLELRSFYRQFSPKGVPDDYYAVLRGELKREELLTSPAYPTEARQARAEALHAELGGKHFPPDVIDARIREALGDAQHWVLIGGPPCQAYSIVGRSRNKGVKADTGDNTKRSFLYREYVRIIAKHWPTVFVMENVKGLLSAIVRDEEIYSRIVKDLLSPATAIGEGGSSTQWRYRIFSLVKHTGINDDVAADPRDFVIHAEHHGIPQARHRVILLGLREDLGTVRPRILGRSCLLPASCVLDGLPRLRAGLSREEDSPGMWRQRLTEILPRRWLRSAERMGGQDVVQLLLSTLAELAIPRYGRGAEFIAGQPSIRYRPDWYLDPRLQGVCNHSSRVHMAKDLHRYLYASCFAKVHAESPRLSAFPRDLLPNHRNVEQAVSSRHFADRFRVQVATKPATTITSHIHKDGHYYIHPDPTQCRSLTVREAARLQTFPDNYFFCGPRTAQYVQVGNAVPPLLAKQIAEVVLDVLIQSGVID